MLSKEEIENQRFTNEEINVVKEYIKERLKYKDWDNKAFYIAMNAYTLVKHIENIETDKQNLIDKLEEDIENDYHVKEYTGNNYCITGEIKIPTRQYAQEILSILKDNKKLLFLKSSKNLGLFL